MRRIWGRRSAYNVQKVLWALGELDLPFEHVDAGGSAGGLDTPAFRARNPHGRIPVLEDEDVVVWESNSIVRYLCARYDPGGLWPEDPAERSRAERWMDWELATLQPAWARLFWGWYRTPEARRDATAVQRALERCTAVYGALDARLEDRPFLAGASFGMADIACGTGLHRWYGMGIPLPDLPHLRAFADRLAERPGFREHVMVPFDELRGRLTF